MHSGSVETYNVQFFYDYVKPRYRKKCKLLFTDTDSLCLEITTEIETSDLYNDMSEAMDLFDTSNFDPSHPLYSTHNHKVLGKMKSETGSTPPVEFVGLRAKMYSVSCGNKSQKKAKGIKKNYVKTHVRHQSFLEVIRDPILTTDATFCLFQSRDHQVRTMEINKVCLSAFDDKRYILDDGVTTLAYGHEQIRN